MINSMFSNFDLFEIDGAVFTVFTSTIVIFLVCDEFLGLRTTTGAHFGIDFTISEKLTPFTGLLGISEGTTAALFTVFLDIKVCNIDFNPRISLFKNPISLFKSPISFVKFKN